MRTAIWPVLFRLCLGFLSLLLVSNGALNAQETRGQILGRILDQSGAVVVGATVKALNTGTNVAITASTNESGDYFLPLLLPGTYTLSAEMRGFKTFVEESIPVQVASRMTINIALEVGQASESVRVVGEAPLIETSTASMGQVIDQRGISELPQKDGNPIMLSNLAPGVFNMTTPGWTRAFDNGSSSSFSANGTPSAQNEFTMDGAPNTQRNFVAYVPPADTVQEFKIQTTSIDASTGFTAGAVINVSLKSGTNEIHGSAYYFVQNSALNANSFFTNRAGLKKPPLKMHRYGINASGPVFIPKLYNGKNRTFWMYGYEGIKDCVIENQGTYAVPTAAQRRGDFSALLKVGSQYQIYDPFSTTPAAAGRFSRQPLAGNIIPASYLNKTAQTLVNYYSEPNQQGTADGTDNFYWPGTGRDSYYTHLFRVDHNVSANHRVFLRGDVNKRVEPWDVLFNQARGSDFYRKNQGLAVDDVYTFNPRFLLNARYSYTRFYEGEDQYSARFDMVKDLGFAQAFADSVKQIDARAPRFPAINVSGYGAFATNPQYYRYNDIHDLAANFSMMHLSHTVRFGMNYRAYRENGLNFGYPSGSFSHATNWTRGPLDNSPGAPMGQSMASFLMGLPTSGSLNINSSLAEQSSGWALYIQDDWKLTNKLTLNLGLRYDMELPTTERYNRTVRDFDASTPSPIETQAKANYARNPIPEVPVGEFRALGGLRFAGVGGQPRGLWETNKRNLMPRIGMAYAINPRTVVRGGYGTFYDVLGIVRRQVNQSGFSRTTDFVATVDNGQTYIANLTNPFPSGFDMPAGAGLGLMTFVGQGISYFNTKLENPFTHRWHVSVQRQFGREMVFEIAYVGSRGTDVRISRQLNPTPRKYLSTSPVRDQATIDSLSAAVQNPFYPLLPKTSLSGTTVSRSQLLRPYPHFTGVSYDTNEGYFLYNALQTRFEKRFSAGYTVNVAWTWSKNMAATGFLNETDPNPVRAIAAYDRPQRIVASGTWELPFGKGKAIGSGARGPLNAIVGGWQVQAIYQKQSGQPLGFGNAIFNGDLHAIPLPSGQRTAERWFNTEAGFQRDSRIQLGSNIVALSPLFSGIRSYGLNNWDCSVFKNTRIHEHLSSQFRAEFINAFNHPQFGVPNTSPTSTSFGRVNADSQIPRTIQFALKLLF